MNAMIKEQKALCYSVDWLTVNVYASSLDEFLDWFDTYLPHATDAWMPGKSKFFYDHSLKLNGGNTVTLDYCFKKELTASGQWKEIDVDTIEDRSESGVNRGILLNISGDGLRYLGNKAVEDLMYRINDAYECHWTRIDVALDMYDPDNVVIPLLLDSVNNTLDEAKYATCVVTKSRSMKIYKNRDPLHKCTSLSAEIGRRGGGKFVRIYDKSLEQRSKSYNAERLDEIPDYWYRIELQIMNTNSYRYPDIYMQYLLEGRSLSEVFLAHLQQCFNVRDVKGRYSTHFDAVDNELWQQFLEELSNNTYFVQLDIKE